MNPAWKLLPLCACLAACDAAPPLPPYQPPSPATMQEIHDFASAISAIGREVKQLGVPDELFASKPFNQLYTHPEGHLAAAMALMGGADASAHDKKIAGYAMQRLPPEQFVAFIAAAIDSVERGQTGMDVLERTAFAPLNFGRQTLIMYYQHPTVRALLNRLSQMPQLSPARLEYIRDDILTGKAKQDYLDYLAMIGRPEPE